MDEIVETTMGESEEHHKPIGNRRCLPNGRREYGNTQ